MVLSFIETKREERPKRPVSKGKRGSFIGRFKVKKPRKPASKKTVNERRNLSSLKIKYREAKIRIKGRKGWRNVERWGIKRINRGERRTMRIIEAREP